MVLSGQLSDFSLPELFQVVEQGNKTGTITFRIFNKLENKFDKKYIVLHQGQIVSVSDDLSGQSLLSLMQRENIIDQTVLFSLMKLFNKLHTQTSMGDYLQAQNILDAEQIKTLFDLQVVNPVCNLFELENAWFTFNPSMTIGLGELTGLSISPTELNLRGLRAVKSWKNFTDKLPDTTSGLLRTSQRQFSKQLTALEEKVLALATGTLSLKQMVPKLEVTLETVQKMAFCLISTGLAEELPILDTSPVPELNQTAFGKVELGTDKKQSLCMNQDFLMNLTSYLKVKTTMPPAASPQPSR